MLTLAFRKRSGDDACTVEDPPVGPAGLSLCADLGIMPEPCPNHAAYLDNWLKVLKADKRAIFTAASATDYLAGLQATEITEAAA